MDLRIIYYKVATVFYNYSEHKKWCKWNEENNHPCHCKGFLFSLLGNALGITEFCCECPWDTFIY